ncbi:maleylpyruvate isomerase family mycothiol-dependent enzyme [Janibacter terrae]|uniref:Maleylpyruvate isomerase family mycothiol-dependent enzyme n=1 Tax=Janibacter terrae TaxID=103817 RepID=A0ABZ2FJK7_9MICO|nr:maleylpyruvate isomerase family mycothiol-dependent enzyme [Janibacter terrae]
MTRPDPLALWDETSRDLLAVLRELGDDDWDRPALPGWTVKDVLAHLAHLESEAAGMDQPEGGRVAVESGANQPMPTDLTGVGVAARRERSAATLLDEFETACVARREVLAALDQSDPGTPAPGIVGDLGWDLRTLLRNRPIDLWVHEQDIRRATGRPMTTTGVGAAHVAGLMTKVFPTTLRRLPVGTSVVATITGPQGRVLAARVGEDGRAAPFDPSEGSDVALEMDDATWLLLTGGRITPEEAAVEVTGDADLAATVLGRLNVTP